MYTRLGENLEHVEEAEAIAAHYLDVIDKIVAAGIKGEISVKPTQLGMDLDPEICFGHLERIAEKAAAAGSYLWIDMESSAYAEPTIACTNVSTPPSRGQGSASRPISAGPPSRHRAAAAIDPAIRLVKGAYDEKASIAYRRKSNIDANYVGLAVGFLSAAVVVRSGLASARTTSP